jgi:hypothetical protein
MIKNENSIVENTLLQIKAVEDAISENAKGILASTMKEEISELVRESLSGSKKRKLREQEEESPEDEVEIDVEDEENVEEPTGDEEEDDDFDANVEFNPENEVEPEGDNQEELPPLDMRQAPMNDLYRVFKAMGEDDGIIVASDEDDIYLKDGENEYIIRTGSDSNAEMNMQNTVTEDVLYELVLEMGNHKEIEEGDWSEEENYESYENVEEGDWSEEENYESYENVEEDMSFNPSGYKDDLPEENVYEIDQEALESVLESFKYSKTPNMEKVSYKKSEAPKRHGKGGNVKNAMKYPSSMKHGVSEIGQEHEEFEGWEKETDEDLVKGHEKEDAETSEASRTMTYRRRAERNRVTAPRQVRNESVEKEMNLLKEKNEEYKKALDFFRTKLNEVAVFNSNLAYSTRLFTEHSTTKQEKINILRRFDSVESLKESKNLYKTIKSELVGNGTATVVKESITERVVKTPQNGSATNLIESKTYENPQFLRMKDLMTKIK